MEKKIGIVGHGRIGRSVAEAVAYESLKGREGILLVSPEEAKKMSIEEICKPEPYIFRASPQIDELLSYDLFERTTSKGDLKRCKKGIHNYSHKACLHCKKEIK